MPQVKRSVKERLLSKVRVLSSGCWEYTGALTKNGYGKFAMGHSNWEYAHRVCYETFKGPVPPERELDHNCHDRDTCRAGKLCPHRRCINPDHLEPATHHDNATRANFKGKCAKGHDKEGHEHCPTCYKKWTDENRERLNKLASVRYWLDPEKSRKKSREKEARRRHKLPGRKAG